MLEITYAEIIDFLRANGFDVEEEATTEDENAAPTVSVKEMVADNIRVVLNLHLDEEIKHAQAAGYDKRQFLMSLLQEIREDIDNAPRGISKDAISPEMFRQNARIGVRKTTPTSDALKRPTAFEGIEEFVYTIVDTPTMRGFINVNEFMLEMLEVSKEEAFEIAKENSHRTTVIMSMAKYLSIAFDMLKLEEDDDSLDEVPMFIATTAEQAQRPDLPLFGAAVMLDKESLVEFSKAAKIDKWTLLPSSKGEILLVPYVEGTPLDFYKELVKEVNGTLENKSEILIDNAYIIDGETGEPAA